MVPLLSLGPLAVTLLLVPFLPCCAQRLGSHRSRRAGWQLPGLTLAHGSPTVATGRVLLFSPARAQICCLAAFPAQGLPLGQVGPGDSSRENSSHKFMGCDKSHKQGNSRALGLGPGDSFQPGQFGRRGWAKPQWVKLQARSLALHNSESLLSVSLFSHLYNGRLG